MNRFAHAARIVIIYVMITAVASLVLNYVLIESKPEIELGHWMALFGPAIFLLFIFWGGPLHFVAIFGAYYLISTILILTPVIIAWKREAHVRRASLGVGAAIWLVIGSFVTMI